MTRRNFARAQAHGKWSGVVEVSRVEGRLDTALHGKGQRPRAASQRRQTHGAMSTLTAPTAAAYRPPTGFHRSRPR